MKEIIDEEQSLKVLNGHLDRLHFENLIGLECSLNFDIGTDNPKVRDFIRTFSQKNSDNDIRQLDTWIKSIQLADLLSIPFSSIIISCLPGKECIEVSSIDFFTTSDISSSGISGLEASRLQIQSFKDHVKRAVKEKRKKGQRETGKPFIVIIETRLDDWQYQYEIGDDNFMVLKNEIKQELRNVIEISGVIIFYSGLYQGRYVENKFADQKIRIQLKDLENMKILRRRETILIDEDLTIGEKEDPIKQLIKMRRCTDIENDITSQPDKMLLLRNIQIFLTRRHIDDETLSRIEPIILKYTMDNDNHTYTEILEKVSNSLDLGQNVRAEAVFCMFYFWRHKYCETQMESIRKLSEDESLRVKFNVAKGLPEIYRRNKNVCLNIIIRYMSENWFTRYCLQHIISFFCEANIETQLQLQMFAKIIEFDEEDKKHLDSLLHTLQNVSKILISHSLFNSGLRDYIRELIENQSGSVLLYIAKNSGFGQAVDFCELHEWIVELNTRLLKSTYLEVKYEASHSFLSNLVSNNITLYPRIKDYLDLLSTTKVKGNNSMFAFPILRYLDRFYEYFPIEACSYLMTVFNSNSLEDLSSSSHHMFQLIDNLLKSDLLSETYRNSLNCIVKKCSTEGDYSCKHQADVLIEKYKIT